MFTFARMLARNVESHVSIKATLTVVTMTTHGVVATVYAHATRLFLAAKLVQVQIEATLVRMLIAVAGFSLF